MDHSKNDLHDFYHDDPVDQKSDPTRKNPSPIFAIIALVIGGGFFLQTTFAANISLSSNSSVEFGQGSLQTTVCSGDTQLTLTPNSAFANVAGAGTYNFSSVTVSGIPDSCWGNDFTISAYDESSDIPLALFNSTSTKAVVFNNAGTFQSGTGVVGMSITSAANTFTITFDSPVALASSVARLTIESGTHTPYACAEGGSCILGDRGPGNGFVFYISEDYFTSPYSTCNTTCKYLEVAPSGWNGSSDATKKWATGTSTTGNASYDSAIPNDNPANNALATIGLGSRNTYIIYSEGNDSTTVGGEIYLYSGGSQDDWFLPNTAELNQLCKWVRGVTSPVTTVCTGGTLNSSIYGAESAGFKSSTYFSSSEFFGRTNAWYQSFFDGTQSSTAKLNPKMYRPVRAF